MGVSTQNDHKNFNKNRFNFNLLQELQQLGLTKFKYFLCNKAYIIFEFSMSYVLPIYSLLNFQTMQSY